MIGNNVVKIREYLNNHEFGKTHNLSTDNAKGSPAPEKWDVPKLVKLGVGARCLHCYGDVQPIIHCLERTPHSQHTSTTYLLLHGNNVHGAINTIHSQGKRIILDLKT